MRNQRLEYGPSFEKKEKLETLKESLKTRKINSKSIFNTGEDECRVSREQAEKALPQTRKIKDLKYLLNVKEVISKDV